MDQKSYIRCPFPPSSVRARLHEVCRNSFTLVELGREEESERAILRVDFESAEDQAAFRRTLAQTWTN